MSSYKKLYLDDLRTPEDAQDWVICRTVDEAKRHVLECGLPTLISFDHDLGEGEPDGLQFAKWLVKAHLDGVLSLHPSCFEWTVHSMNPVGKENITGLLSSFQHFLVGSEGIK